MAGHILVRRAGCRGHRHRRLISTDVAAAMPYPLLGAVAQHRWRRGLVRSPLDGERAHFDVQAPAPPADSTLALVRRCAGRHVFQDLVESTVTWILVALAAAKAA